MSPDGATREGEPLGDGVSVTDTTWVANNSSLFNDYCAESGSVVFGAISTAAGFFSCAMIPGFGLAPIEATIGFFTTSVVTWLSGFRHYSKQVALKEAMHSNKALVKGAMPSTPSPVPETLLRSSQETSK